MKRFMTRRFITIVCVVAWIAASAFGMWVGYLWGDKDMFNASLTGLSGVVGIIIGFYFGKSTAIEGVRDGKGE